MMAARSTAPVPPPAQIRFEGAIRHPGLWLWDSWTLQDEEGLHLYCLALSRTGHDGAPIRPPQRNDHAFHVRHFRSVDGGANWSDAGPAILPGGASDGADTRNVWSGSVLRLPDGRYAYGYTGLREGGPERRFIQTICIGFGETASRMDTPPAAALSCPLRDHEAIRAAGFYLPPRETVGANTGEAGGPILAWRDPFLLQDAEGTLHAWWSAKVGPTRPAIAHARLALRGGEAVVEHLSAPILLPDAEEYTQAEVPKVYFDAASGGYLLLISTCDRMFEGQPDSDVKQQLRLYRSAAPTGPWAPALASGSLLPGLETLFGASLIAHDMAEGRLSVLGPFTENAGETKQLSFPAVRHLEVEVAGSSRSGRAAR